MNDSSHATAPTQPRTMTPAEERLMSGFAVLSLSLMGLAVVLMGFYMYFLPGANSPLSIIPQL
jgi:hypothetical protein